MTLFRHREGLKEIFQAQKWRENTVAVVLNEDMVSGIILPHPIKVALIPAKETFLGLQTIQIC